jgi:phosphogluconate dehydratase
MNPTIEAVTARIVERSGPTRDACLERCRPAAETGPARAHLSNIAHVAVASTRDESGSAGILRPVDEPFQPTGGLRLLDGSLGRAVIKTSAVKPEHRVIEAPARVFHDQEEVKAASKVGELHRDMIVVVRFQGPKANGMPELHSLTPPLGVTLDRRHKVALVTDGRMSGASGKVPAAIHVSPEAADAGPIPRLRDGNPVRLDAETGRLEVLVDAAEFDAREPARPDLSANQAGIGRELFGAFRAAVGPAETGAAVVV